MLNGKLHAVVYIHAVLQGLMCCEIALQCRAVGKWRTIYLMDPTEITYVS